MKEIPFIFKKYLFIYLTLGFIAFTVIGTLSHEFGHYAVAKYFGYNPRIGYAYTIYGGDSKNKRLYEIWNKREFEIDNKKTFPEKAEFEKLHDIYLKEGRLTTLGGPIETLLTSLIGIIFLIIFKKKINSKDSLSKVNWLTVFTALFILRQSANMFVGFGILLLTSRTPHGDEFGISWMIGLNPWALDIITGVLGLLFLAWIIFRIIPISERFTFILSGIFGGVSGYILWLILLGPIILP